MYTLVDLDTYVFIYGHYVFTVIMLKVSTRAGPGRHGGGHGRSFRSGDGRGGRVRAARKYTPGSCAETVCVRRLTIIVGVRDMRASDDEYTTYNNIHDPVYITL